MGTSLVGANIIRVIMSEHQPSVHRLHNIKCLSSLVPSRSGYEARAAEGRERACNSANYKIRIDSINFTCYIISFEIRGTLAC